MLENPAPQEQSSDPEAIRLQQAAEEIRQTHLLDLREAKDLNTILTTPGFNLKDQEFTRTLQVSFRELLTSMFGDTAVGQQTEVPLDPAGLSRLYYLFGTQLEKNPQANGIMHVTPGLESTILTLPASDPHHSRRLITVFAHYNNRPKNFLESPTQRKLAHDLMEIVNRHTPNSPETLRMTLIKKR